MHESRGDQVRKLRIGRLSRRAALRSAVGGGVVAFAAGAAPRASAQATPTAVPPIVERWAAAWNAHSPEQMAALFTDDGVYEDLAFEFVWQGKEGIATWVTITLAGAPDTRVELVYAFQDGDRSPRTGSSRARTPGRGDPTCRRPGSRSRSPSPPSSSWRAI